MALFAFFGACLGDVHAAGTASSTVACDEDVAAAAARILTIHRETMARACALPSGPDAVKARLAAMRQGDQDIRFLGIGLMNRCGLLPESEAMRPVAATWRAIDDANQAALGRLLREVGWPVRSIYGAQADQSAFLVAQHADRDPAFQKHVLDLLEPEWRAKETSGENYALLFDRVRVGEGKPQRYGSQGDCQGRRWIPKAIEAAGLVDRRRKAVGLAPMAVYSNRMSQLFCAGGA